MQNSSQRQLAQGLLVARSSQRGATTGGTTPPTKAPYDIPWQSVRAVQQGREGGACSGEEMNDQTDQSGRGGRWLTYRGLAERLGISVEAAQQKARRGRWQRRDSND